MAREVGIDGYSEFITVTPSNTADLANPCDAIWVSAGGNIAFTDLTGHTVTLTVIASTAYPLPVRARRILATGTTASVIALRK